MGNSIFILLLNLLFLNVAFTQNFNQTQSRDDCFLSQNSTSWKLVYHDEFEFDHLSSDWLVEHETGKCHGNWIRQISCNTKHNIKLFSGFLILFARHEQYNEANYTAAMLTSKHGFSEGRYEIRASQPVGLHIRTTMHTVNPKEAYWHELGQLDMASNNNQEPVIHHAVHLSNSSVLTQYKASTLDPLETDLHEFHLYGAEWNQTSIRFFFDSQYTEPIELTQEHGIFPGQHFRIQLGVGLEFFQQKTPEQFERFQWKCPALVIDYIRVYERVVNETKHSKECEDLLHNSDEQALQKICDQVMEGMVIETKNNQTNQIDDKLSNSKLNSTIILVTIFFAAFIFLVAFLIIQLRKINKKIDLGNFNQSSQIYSVATGGRDSTELYYEISYPGTNEDERNVQQMKDSAEYLCIDS